MNNTTYMKLSVDEQNIINELIKCNDLICMYEFGSTVYNSNDEDSDIDFILIVNNNSIFNSIENENDVFCIMRKYATYIENNDIDEENINSQFQYKYKNISFNIYPEMKWIVKNNELSIDALECGFLNKNFIYKENKKYLPKELDKIQLRKSISAVVSNSCVKGKKKIIQGDDRIGYKSIFHSIRILMFGIQIYQYGYIKYYNEPTIEFYNLIKSRYFKFKNKGLLGLELYNNIINDSELNTINLKSYMNKQKTFFKLFTDKEWKELKQNKNIK